MTQLDKHVHKTEFLKRGFYPLKGPHRKEFAYDDEKAMFRDLKDTCPRSYKHWKQNPFEYRINSWGHRGDEFEQGRPLFFGCSYTWGWGMPEEWSWPWLVGASLGTRINNMGFPGEGGDRAVMLALAWIEELRPSHVYWLDLFTTRRTWLLDWDRIQFMNHDAPEGRKTELKILQRIAVSEAQEWLDIQRNTLAIERLCERVGCGLTRMGPEDFKKHIAENNSRNRETELRSRDNGNHPTREEHALIAQWFLDTSSKPCGFL